MLLLLALALLAQVHGGGKSDAATHTALACRDKKSFFWCDHKLSAKGARTRYCATDAFRGKCLRSCSNCTIADSAIEDIVRLAENYRTDKLDQGFAQLYGEHFGQIRQSVRRVLEVGVFFGASLMMWRDYFPNALVYGLDSFKGIFGYKSTHFNNPELFLERWRKGEVGPRLKLIVANQSDPADMARAVAELGAEAVGATASTHLEASEVDHHGLFDIIVEDGSHLYKDQLLNLAQLLPLVRPGGVYVIEDLHTSLETGWLHESSVVGT